MKSILPAILLTALFLAPVNQSFAQKTPEQIRTQIRTQMEETRSSPDWVYIGQTDHGYIGFLGKERFSVEGGERRAWTRVYVRDGEQVMVSRRTAKILMYRLTHRIYDCRGSRISDIKSIEYFTDGTNDVVDYIKFYKTYPEKRWTEIVPGTIGDILLTFVCSYKP